MDISIMEWFDRSAERELKKRRETYAPRGLPSVKIDRGIKSSSLPPRIGEKIAEIGGEKIGIASKLKGNMETELSEAVDKLAAAQEICSFLKAMEVAEEAVKTAPADLVEEYALAGVKEFQTEVTGEVKGYIPGERPVEVIGYVGITKPKFPRAPK